MAEPGALSADLLESLNLFLNEATPEEGLTCPVTGEQVGIAEWNAPASIVNLPGKDDAPGFEVLPLTSPMGGVVLIAVAKLTAWQKKSEQNAQETSPDHQDQPSRT